MMCRCYSRTSQQPLFTKRWVGRLCYLGLFGHHVDIFVDELGHLGYCAMILAVSSYQLCHHGLSSLCETAGLLAYHEEVDYGPS